MSMLRHVRVLPLFLVSTLGLGTLGACSGGTPGEPPNVEVEVLALEGDIGPEGGELTGASGTALAGVRLAVPRGALGERTHLRIVPALDQTPLPEEAVRVGFQFVLETAVTFTEPVRLTLPVDRDFSPIASRDGGAGLKVWMRAPDGSFRLIEPLEANGASVTIATTRFDVAAAGIKVHPTPTHPGCGPVGCVDLVACTDANGLCASAPVDLPFSTFGNGALGMLRPTAYGTRDAERIVFYTGASVGQLALPDNRASFSPQVLPSAVFFGESGLFNSFTLAHRSVDGIAGDAGTAILGRFAMPSIGSDTPKSTGPSPSAFASSPSRGAITLGDGRTVVLLGGSTSTPSFVIRASSGQVSAPVALAGPVRALVAAAPARSRPDAFWLFSHSAGQPRIELVDTSGNVVVAPTLPPAIANRLLAQLGGNDDSPVAATTGLVVTAEGALLGLADIGAQGTSDRSSLLLVRPDGSFELRAPLGETITNIQEIDADRDGHVWMRTFLADGSSGLLFLGKGGLAAPKFVPLDRSLFIHEVFPSADRGVWVEVRALTGATRPLRLVKVRPTDRS